MPMDDRAAAALHRRVNRWSARIVPVILIGIVGYVSWTVVALLAVNTLLYPPADLPPRRGTGIAILVLYFILVMLMSITYFRILLIIAINPGIVPRPSAQQASPTSSRWGHSSKDDAEKNIPSSADSSETGIDPTRLRGYLDRAAVLDGRERPPLGLDEFSSRDVYECDIDGLPRWCATCLAWKPDRSHHSTELGRCVYKMDHFCPWAGGVVAENNFKFFVQFCFYTMLFCAFVMIVTAYYLAKVASQREDLYKVNWIVTIVFAALFFCFTGGMALNSLKFSLENTGTIDSLSRTTRVYSFAVRVPPSVLDRMGARHEPQPLHQGAHPDPLGEAGLPFPTITFPLGSAVADGVEQRTFAILRLPSGKNPYSMASAFDNFREVFGDTIWDWLLPISHSPCASHSRFGAQPRPDGGTAWSMYPTGPVVDKMIADAGIQGETANSIGRRSRRKERSGRRRQSVREYHDEKQRQQGRT